jgi:hypothetical protein
MAATVARSSIHPGCCLSSSEFQDVTINLLKAREILFQQALSILASTNQTVWVGAVDIVLIVLWKGNHNQIGSGRRAAIQHSETVISLQQLPSAVLGGDGGRGRLGSGLGCYESACGRRQIVCSDVVAVGSGFDEACGSGAVGVIFPVLRIGSW